MSPVSIMYSLRSYNAGEVGEGVLRESRVAVYGRVWAEGLRGSLRPVTTPVSTSRAIAL